MAQLSLYAFTLFYIGRLHELFSVLQSTHTVFVLTGVSVLSAIALRSSAKHNIWHEREVRLVVFLAVLAFVLVPFSVWPGLSLKFTTLNYLRLVLLFCLVATVATTPRVATGLVLSLLLASTFLSLFTLREAAALAEGGKRVFVSQTYDPNDLAMIIDCILPFAVLGAISMAGLPRLLAVVGAAVGVMAVVKTMSRAGFIGLVVIALLLVLRWKGVALWGRLTMLAIGVLMLLAVVPQNYWYAIGTLFNLNPTFDEGYLEAGILGRTEIWKQGLALFARYSIIGTGAGAFLIAEGMSHGGVGKWSAAHNSFIQIGTELGIIGFAVFVALLVISVQNARAAARAARAHVELSPLEWIATAVEMSLYTFMVVGFALSQAYSPLLYFLFGLSTALRLQVGRHMLTPPVPVVRRRSRSRAS
jgi:O-antigen ligase